MAPAHNQRTIMTRNIMTKVYPGNPLPEGVPAEGKCLMVHPGKGYRWIAKSERKAKEKWGYEYVRGYNAADALTAKRVEDMSGDELRQRAEALDNMAEDVDASKEKKATETAFEGTQAKREAEEKANKGRVAAGERGRKRKQTRVSS